MNRSPRQKKKRSNILHVALFFFALCVVGPALSQQQSKKELENKKKSLQNEINETKQLLEETKKNKKLSLGQLVMLNKMISAREELITNINSEIDLLDKQIAENNNSITVLRKDLEKLKAEYARMVYFAWKNRDSYTRMMYIFAAQDFRQAYMRLKYFQQYSDYRKKQAMMIEKTQSVLNEKIVQLESRKTDKKVLLVSQEGEKKNLTSEKKEKEETLVQLQDKEQQLKKELEKKKKDAERLQLAIKKVIEEEIAKAKREEEERLKELAKKNAGKNTPVNNTPNKTVTTPSLTPESLELSTSFANNKGKLPWPVLKGVITEGFGEHEHPTLKDVITFNNGVDISTTKNALVRAVFDGEVKGSGILPGAGRFVIIRHGEYLSVYSNLGEVYVNTGDKVKTKQTIATALFDDNDGKSIVQLQIWKGQTKLDPEEWLSKSSK